MARETEKGSQKQAAPFPRRECCKAGLCRRGRGGVRASRPFPQNRPHRSLQRGTTMSATLPGKKTREEDPPGGNPPKNMLLERTQESQTPGEVCSRRSGVWYASVSRKVLIISPSRGFTDCFSACGKEKGAGNKSTLKKPFYRTKPALHGTARHTPVSPLTLPGAALALCAHKT